MKNNVRMFQKVNVVILSKAKNLIFTQSLNRRSFGLKSSG